MKKFNPLVSIIVTTYRREHVLKKTLSSILNQTYKNLEVIVVNDEKHPSINNLIQEFKDDRLKLIEIPHSGRPAVPRNMGIAHSSGELIAFCDDDDTFLPDKVELQLNAFKINPHIKLCYTDSNLINEYDELILSAKLGNYINTFQKQLLHNNITFSTIMIKKETLIKKAIKFDERPILRASEDYLFIMNFLYNEPFVYIPTPLVNYRIHQNGISFCNKKRKFIFYYLRIVMCMYTFLKEKKISLFNFLYLIGFHLKLVMKQILFPYYNQFKKIWRIRSV